MIRKVKRAIRGVARIFGYDLIAFDPANRCEHPAAAPDKLRPEFRHLMVSGFAMQKLLDDCTFETVLDVGCGAGEQTEVFLAHGKRVTGLDYGKSVYFERNPSRGTAILGDFNTMILPEQYDCVWASHILEHQPNVNVFLKKIFDAAKEGGLACITVPPQHREVLGGHLTVWNAGLLLYNLVLAGFDCRDVSILKYGFNISVLLRKRSAVLPELVYDNGDVNRIGHLLPDGFREGFNGDIMWHNW